MMARFWKRMDIFHGKPMWNSCRNWTKNIAHAGLGTRRGCNAGLWHRACATLVAAVLNHLVKREADILLDGGRLHVEWDGTEKDHVFMTGPAVKVYEGEYPLEGE